MTSSAGEVLYQGDLADVDEGVKRFVWWSENFVFIFLRYILNAKTHVLQSDHSAFRIVSSLPAATATGCPRTSGTALVPLSSTTSSFGLAAVVLRSSSDAAVLLVMSSESVEPK